MKKAQVLCGVLLGSLLLSAAPVSAVDVVGKGLKGGFILADMNGDDWDAGFKAKSGYALGAFMTLDLGPGLFLQPEFLFVQKGSRMEEEDLTLAVRLNYFEIPVLLKFALVSGPGARIFFFAGPALAMEFDSRLYMASGGESSTQNFNESKSFDIGLTFGAGVEVPLGRHALLFDVRYTHGLTDCCGSSTGGSYRVKNSAICLLAGIGF